MPDESTEMIELKMQETRDSLTQKVSALENQVVDTLHNATATVSSMVDQVKTAVPETLGGLKDSIAEAKESVAKQVKETLDVSHHTRERPWAMVGGAAALGFISGMILFRRSYAAPVAPAYRGATSSAPMPVAATGPSSGMKLPGWLDHIVGDLTEKVTAEVRKLGEVAIASASTSLKQTVEQTLPKFIGNMTQGGAAAGRFSTEEHRNGIPATSAKL